MKKNLQKEYDKELEENRIKLNKELRISESKDIENEEYDRVWENVNDWKKKNGAYSQDINLILNPELGDEEPELKKQTKETKDKTKKKKGKKNAKEA